MFYIECYSCADDEDLLFKETLGCKDSLSDLNDERNTVTFGYGYRLCTANIRS